MMLLDHGYNYLSLQEAQYLTHGIEPLAMGNGVKNFGVRSRRTNYAVKNRVYKLWDKNYRKAKKFMGAIHAGFIDQSISPALRAVILDVMGNCCGYVMTRCRLNVTIYERASLIRKLKTQTRKTGWCYTDIDPTNMGICTITHRISLLDLESVSPLTIRSEKTCKDISYKNFLKRLALKGDLVYNSISDTAHSSTG